MNRYMDSSSSRSIKSKSSQSDGGGEDEKESESPHALVDLYLWRQRLRLAQELHLQGMTTRAERILREMEERKPSLEAQLQLFFSDDSTGAERDVEYLDEDIAAVNVLIPGSIPVVEGLTYSGTLSSKYSALVQLSLCEAYAVMSLRPHPDDNQSGSGPHSGNVEEWR